MILCTSSTRPQDMQTHLYGATVEWTAGTSGGTRRPGYSRSFLVRVPGKPLLQGSADPLFRGDPGVHNPEDLLLAAVSGCHMLTYLALCAQADVAVVAYVDTAVATMEVQPGGGGRFTSLVLEPRVVVEHEPMLSAAHALHAEAGTRCFIANSLNIPVRHRVGISVQGAVDAAGDGAPEPDTECAP